MVTLSIADIIIAIQTDPPDLEGRMADQFRGFLAEQNQAPDCALTIQALPRENVVREIEVAGSDGVFDIRGEDFSCRWDKNAKTARAGLYPEKTVINTFLRVFCSVLLAEHGGFLIHSAGLSYRDKGYLFVGKSSSGKTTAARLARESARIEVLNDELVAVRQAAGRFYLYATPFKGEDEGPLQKVKVPLEKFFFLKKNQRETDIIVERVPGAVALLENVFFFAQDEALQARILSLCCAMASGIPSFDVNLFRAESLEQWLHEHS